MKSIFITWISSILGILIASKVSTFDEALAEVVHFSIRTSLLILSILMRITQRENNTLSLQFSLSRSLSKKVTLKSILQMMYISLKSNLFVCVFFLNFEKFTLQISTIRSLLLLFLKLFSFFNYLTLLTTNQHPSITLYFDLFYYCQLTIHLH